MTSPNPVDPDDSEADRFFVSPAVGSSVRSPRQTWQRSYVKQALILDISIVAAAAGFAFLVDMGGKTSVGPGQSISMAVLWTLFLAVLRTRDTAIVGNGYEEYRRVITATAALVGVIAIVALFLQAGIAREYLVLSFPTGLIGLVLGRHFLRRRLAQSRGRGENVNDMIVVGTVESVRSLSHRFDSTASAGYRVIGACVPNYDGDTLVVGDRIVPVFGDLSSLDFAITTTTATAVAVASTEQLGYEGMKNLAWKLDNHDIDLIVSPGVADLSVPRMRIEPIDGLPILQIGQPSFEGAHVAAKSVFGFFLASFGLVVTAPVLLAAAIAIKLEDGGPVFFRQRRVGRGGKVFRIWKLRTMVVNADSIVSDARDAAGQNESVFYKSANDARITKIGRFLRRTSIDELPQLFNVIAGDMSIVGPRPLVEGEGSNIAHFIQRRSLVKPGVTGLWQVSGRSDVTEEERIRLDHLYIDNWSPVQDLVIVWRTIAAVIKSDGAY
ncbi:polyprenyl glycosylphosphotransferase [Rhodococcoides trifolii]|uniref:Polyprenyl glycosylphosphotransferase n=1 Tax=Rhodococcoides trifolii TaxID=908250 RepID=A0A917G8S1_9NOCA|nr:sugar transferase [Rhodococcus trifolii]GGG29151.1 polyprenyl glycosylphosphotransferase [Rhodococcus trifolii]